MPFRNDNGVVYEKALFLAGLIDRCYDGGLGWMTTLTYTRLAALIFAIIAALQLVRAILELADHSGDGRGSNVPADLAELDSLCCFTVLAWLGFTRGLIEVV